MSSKPVLYYTPRSPPCRAVQLTAAALGIELDLRDINMRVGDHLTPEFLKMNPQHTVPVLDDNGLIVYDSHVICSYLADKYSPDDQLYPKDPIKRMEVDARLYFDCGHLWSRARYIVEPVLYMGEQEIHPDKLTYMQKAYDGVERCLAQPGYDYLCGSHLTIADLCSVATISSSMMFAPIDAEKFPKLTAWVDRLSELPYYEKNNKEGAIMLANLMVVRMAENKKANEAAV